MDEMKVGATMEELRELGKLRQMKYCVKELV